MQAHFCLSGFMTLSTSHGTSQWIIGDIFLRRFVTVFDMENEQIGLAAKPY